LNLNLLVGRYEKKEEHPLNSFAGKAIFHTFAPGKSCTTSSHRIPPGSEGSKGRWLSGAMQVAYPLFMPN